METLTNQQTTKKQSAWQQRKSDNDFSDRFIIVPTISLHPDELYIYGRKEWISEPDLRHKNSLGNLLDNSTHGKLSKQATKKAKRAIKYLLINSNDKKVFNPKFRSTFNFKVNFITLTLASTQIHSHQDIKSKLLNQFFVEAKKKWNFYNYVWRAELQKNGNIHFHILSDKFVPFNELRDTWNRIQNKLGYIDRFQQSVHKKSPNSTDIHSLRQVKNVYKYVTKYMTKEQRHNRIRVLRKDIQWEEVRTSICAKKKVGYDSERETVSLGARKFLGKSNSLGREWACSQSLSNLTGAREDYNSEYLEEIEKLRKDKQSKEIVKDYVSLYYFNSSTVNETDYPRLNSLLKAYIKLIFREPESIKIDTTGAVYSVPAYSSN
jgi:hypothetical protein